MFASARVTPRSSAQSVAPTPAKPTIALRTTSGSHRFEELDRVAADLGVLDAVLGRKAVERRRARLQGAQLELGMRRDDLDRLAADRAGRAEKRHASHR